MDNEISNLIGDIDTLKAKARDINSQLKDKRKNIEKKLMNLYQDYFKNIIKKSGYELTVEKYVDKWNGKTDSLIVKGTDIYLFPDSYHLDNASFRIFLTLNKKYEKTTAEIEIMLCSKKYWECDLYEKKKFTINLNNMNELESKILNEIELLVQINNKRVFSKDYKYSNVSKYGNIQEGFELYKKRIV